MTRVEALEREIEKLSPEERAKLRDWILEHDWQAWDRQIEADAASGGLERVMRGSLSDHKAGKSKEI